jgi:hypothetical protein
MKNVAVLAFPFLLLTGCESTTEVGSWFEILFTIVGGVVAILTPFIAKYVNKLAEFTAEKTKYAILGRVVKVVLGEGQKLVVEEVEHAKAASKDGKLTPEEKKKFAELARDRAIALVGAENLEKVFGGPEEAKKAVGSQVELAVKGLKDPKPVAPADP